MPLQVQITEPVMNQLTRGELGQDHLALIGGGIKPGVSIDDALQKP
ncbi:hypothetical protein A15K_02464 [Escherichia coli KTE205]|nr:hypothetical protein A15K_02464 [Escherichia coli KTE205]